MSYTLAVDMSAWTRPIENLLKQMQAVDGLLDQLTDSAVLPLLERHYNASGIQTRSGVLKAAITKRGALGNRIEKHPHGLSVGVDYGEVPFARWVLEGRGAVSAQRAKALHWVTAGGQDVFVKHVRAAPAHPVYFLTAAEVGDLQAKLGELVTKAGANAL